MTYKEKIHENVNRQDDAFSPYYLTDIIYKGRPDEIYISMEEYAQQEDIAFAEWKDENFTTTNIKGIYSNNIGHYNYKELYELYKQSKQ